MKYHFDFPKSYEILQVENVPENSSPQFFYPRGKPYNDKGLQFLITNRNGETWVDMFFQEVPTCLNAVFTTPHPDKVLIIAGGTAHLLDTVNYAVRCGLDFYVNIVKQCVPEGLTLLAGWTDVVCLDKDGIIWGNQFEYEISALGVFDGVLIVDGVSAGAEEPWQITANLKDGNIISSTGL